MTIITFSLWAMCQKLANESHKSLTSSQFKQIANWNLKKLSNHFVGSEECYPSENVTMKL